MFYYSSFLQRAVSYLSPDFIVMAFGLFSVVVNVFRIHETFCVVCREMKVICTTIPTEAYGRLGFTTCIFGVLATSAVFKVTRCTRLCNLDHYTCWRNGLHKRGFSGAYNEIKCPVLSLNNVMRVLHDQKGFQVTQVSTGQKPTNCHFSSISQSRLSSRAGFSKDGCTISQIVFFQRL